LIGQNSKSFTYKSLQLPQTLQDQGRVQQPVSTTLDLYSSPSQVLVADL